MLGSSSGIHFIPSQEQSEPKFKPEAEKVEINKEDIINTLKVIESLKRKWLSYLK